MALTSQRRVQMVEHHYGGPWSEIKLDILRKYLGFFTSALRKKGFELRYIDGFAGTGSRTVAGEGSVENIFGFNKRLESQDLDGSAKIALATDPPFQRLDFIDDNPIRFSALSALCAGRPEATAHSGDANEILTRGSSTMLFGISLPALEWGMRGSGASGGIGATWMRHGKIFILDQVHSSLPTPTFTAEALTEMVRVSMRPWPLSRGRKRRSLASRGWTLR
jgi:hypothetical protein